MYKEEKRSCGSIHVSDATDILTLRCEGGTVTTEGKTSCLTLWARPCAKHCPSHFIFTVPVGSRWVTVPTMKMRD